MKLKFTDYESQSEQYYSEMLDKFKDQARKVVNKKQQELDTLTRIKGEQEARIARLKARAQERKIKNFWSDESEESEEEPVVNFIDREVDMEEYLYVKAQRKRAKLEVAKWVKKFRDEHNQTNPTDFDTQEIALELADFNHVNQKFLEIKMALINQNKYPFQIEDFYNPEKVLRAAAGATAGGPNRTKTLFSKQTDKFLATLS